jgi:hypothetical protein
MPEVENNTIVETPTEARAGVTGRGVRYVLAFSTIGGAVGVFVVYLWFFA